MVAYLVRMGFSRIDSDVGRPFAPDDSLATLEQSGIESSVAIPDLQRFSSEFFLFCNAS